MNNNYIGYGYSFWLKSLWYGVGGLLLWNKCSAGSGGVRAGGTDGSFHLKMDNKLSEFYIF